MTALRAAERRAKEQAEHKRYLERQTRMLDSLTVWLVENYGSDGQDAWEMACDLLPVLDRAHRVKS